MIDVVHRAFNEEDYFKTVKELSHHQVFLGIKKLVDLYDEIIIHNGVAIIKRDEIKAYFFQVNHDTFVPEYSFNELNLTKLIEDPKNVENSIIPNSEASELHRQLIITTYFLVQKEFKKIVDEAKDRYLNELKIVQGFNKKLNDSPHSGGGGSSRVNH